MNQKKKNEAIKKLISNIDKFQIDITQSTNDMVHLMYHVNRSKMWYISVCRQIGEKQMLRFINGSLVLVTSNEFFDLVSSNFKKLKAEREALRKSQKNRNAKFIADFDKWQQDNGLNCKGALIDIS